MLAMSLLYVVILITFKQAYSLFLEKNVNISMLQVIGCDGKVVFTGSKNGVIR